MKLKVFGLLIALAMVGCAIDKSTVATITATDGTNGQNGHSLVSQYVQATELECDSAGGSRLDIYVDIDDSLSASDGDVYQNSLVVCNGLNGLNGIDGQDGQDGQNGNNGINGHDGIAGPPGSAGPPGLNGNPGHDGAQGPAGAPGTPGAPGQNGSNGQDGAPGQDGKDAHVTPKNVTGNCTNISVGYDAKIKDNTVELFTAGFSCASPKKVFTLTSSSSTFWLSSTELAVFVDPAGLRILTYGN